MISLPKVIDFGTSCYEGSSQSRAPDYVQTRYYRAPEVKLAIISMAILTVQVMMGVAYTGAADMWSLGCIVAELLTGKPIFPGEAEADQLALIMEVVILTVTVMVIGELVKW